MSPEIFKHQPVLSAELSLILAKQPEGIYVDGTFGRGGHSRLILEKLNKNGRLYAFDRDEEAQKYAQESEYFTNKDNFVFIKSPFAEMAITLRSMGVGEVDGILLDLGVSSPQIDNCERGFSYTEDGPLDMRMDRTSGITAAQWLAEASEEDIASVIKRYGEEKFAKRIAKEIVRVRERNPITTTAELSKLISSALPFNSADSKQHPATRSFQAIRIYINDELGQLKKALDAAGSILKAGGILAVISFHSLEDRIVKQFFENCSNPNKFIDSRLPLKAEQLPAPLFERQKRIFPSIEERNMNSRSRSACLRYAVRTAAPWRQGEVA